MKYDIAKSWQAGPRVRVEVDTTGTLLIAVTGSPAGGKDRYIRADLPGVLDNVILKARAWSGEVFPGAEPGREDLAWTWRERAEAWDALYFAYKLPGPPSDGSRVSEFLHDWSEVRRLAKDGHRPEQTIKEYAREWERWW
jgi:hypothetical protein